MAAADQPRPAIHTARNQMGNGDLWMFLFMRGIAKWIKKEEEEDRKKIQRRNFPQSTSTMFYSKCYAGGKQLFIHFYLMNLVTSRPC